MKRICLCAEIHIPHILPHQKTYTREGEKNNNHIIREEKTVKKVASENILPFFQFIQRINSFSDEKITIGISVSGIALTLLQKYIPEVITRLSALKKSNYIELFSETWSHSAVACLNPHSFHRQIQLHDRLMKSYFGEVPGFYLYILRTIPII
jgi:alpha-amylase/alpha-mannosidase (GH57 family)